MRIGFVALPGPLMTAKAQSARMGLPSVQHVLVTISGAPVTADDVAGYFEPGEWEAAKHDDIRLREVRRTLSSITGSLADAVIASREER